jgi:hypothetical protein
MKLGAQVVLSIACAHFSACPAEGFIWSINWATAIFALRCDAALRKMMPPLPLPFGQVFFVLIQHPESESGTFGCHRLIRPKGIVSSGMASEVLLRPPSGIAGRFNHRIRAVYGIHLPCPDTKIQPF